jgi:tetratricopeptide (TPR) repeat protein
MDLNPPLVGRERELELLYDHLGSAISGKGNLILISGEAGIGKTRILTRLSETAEKSGFFRIVGECVPGIPLPYLPFQEAFSAFTVGPFSSISSPDPSGPRQQTSVLMDSLELMTNESAKRPLLICLEDLHWVDSASSQLLLFLARNIKKLRILMVGTYRPEDLTPSESGEVHPLQSSIRIMTREGTLIEVPLGRLGKDDLNKAIEGMLESPTNSEVERGIYDQSGGNPLFAIETLRMLVSEGTLVQNKGKWVMAEGKKLNIPRTIQEVILRRMDKLSKEQRRILEYASVIGESFDTSLISESFGVEELYLLDELDMISQRFQLVAGQEKNYNFTHARVRDVTYDSISKPRRTELHKRVGHSLETKLLDDSLLGALSWHFDQAQLKDKCIKYSLLAGKYCFVRKALKEAIFYYELVLAKTEDDPTFIPERLEALEGLGDLGYSALALAEWYSYYEQFLELNHDKKARARVLAKAGECWDQMGFADINKANELFDEAELLSEGDPRNLAVIEFHRGEISDNGGDEIEALAHFYKSARYYEEMGDSIGTLKCKLAEVNVFRHSYRLNKAKAMAEEALPLAIKSGDSALIVEAMISIANQNARVGETEPAKSYASEGIQLAEKQGLALMWMRGLHHRAVALELEGNLESARKDLTIALERAMELETPFFSTMEEIGLGLCEIELAFVESAEHHYFNGLTIISTLSTYLRSLLSTDLSILRAELLAENDDIEQSDKLYDETISSNEEMRQWYELVNCRSKYGISLAKRGMQEKSRVQFDEAMKVAKRIGCEKRVQLYAKRAGIVFNMNPAQSSGSKSLGH